MTILRQIGRDIWGHEEHVPLAGGLRMPSRATVVRLADGTVMIHSPLAIDDATAREIDALGPVGFIVAPSCSHWMFVKQALQRYRSARVLGAGGLEKKLTRKHQISFEALPLFGHVPAIGDELQVRRIDGVPSMNEHVFLHVPSRSLIVTDLMFNVHACSSWGMRLLLRITGAYGKTVQSRMWRLMVKDRAAAASSASALLSWDFERVVVAHGQVIEDDALERTRRALTWMTGGGTRLLGGGAQSSASASSKS